MRVTQAMVDRNWSRVKESANYKKLMKSSDKTASESNSKGKKTQSKKVGADLWVEKQDDKLIISSVDKNNKKVTLQTLEAKSEMGIKLSKALKFEDDTTVKNVNSRIRDARKNCQISNYY